MTRTRGRCPLQVFASVWACRCHGPARGLRRHQLRRRQRHRCRQDRRRTRGPGTSMAVPPADGHAVRPETVPGARAGDALERAGAAPRPGHREAQARGRGATTAWGEARVWPFTRGRPMVRGGRGGGGSDTAAARAPGRPHVRGRRGGPPTRAVARVPSPLSPPRGTGALATSARGAPAAAGSAAPVWAGVAHAPEPMRGFATRPPTPGGPRVGPRPDT